MIPRVEEARGARRLAIWGSERYRISSAGPAAWAGVVVVALAVAGTLVLARRGPDGAASLARLVPLGNL
jgi:hypothetical protein